MACLNIDTLPTEIFQEIAKRIPGRPFKTELLLVNKNLCRRLMVEQVRNLKLTNNQFDRWIRLITKDDVKRPYSMLQYCNLLDQIHKLKLIVRGEHSAKEMTGFISRCINLRNLSVNVLKIHSLLWDTSPFLDSLPFNLIKLRLSGLPIGNGEGFQFLVKYLMRNTNLAVLNMFDINVDTEKACVLAECLKQNATLTDLTLMSGWNSIYDKGASAFAEYLKQNLSLIKLDIRSNNISDEGAYALAECLKQNSTLRHLELGYNIIGNKGACALAESLNQNSRLRGLNLEHNYITDEGACAFVDCLKQNSTLLQLKFAGNIVMDETLALLKQNTIFVLR